MSHIARGIESIKKTSFLAWMRHFLWRMARRTAECSWLSRPRVCVWCAALLARDDHKGRENVELTPVLAKGFSIRVEISRTERHAMLNVQRGEIDVLYRHHLRCRVQDTERPPVAGEVDHHQDYREQPPQQQNSLLHESSSGLPRWTGRVRVIAIDYRRIPSSSMICSVHSSWQDSLFAIEYAHDMTLGVSLLPRGTRANNPPTSLSFSNFYLYVRRYQNGTQARDDRQSSPKN